MKNKPGVQGGDRATYSVLSLSMSVPISTHIALLTASTSSLIALFQLPLLLPWINSRRVSTCLAPSPRCRSHSSFPSPLLPCTLVPFSWTKFCLAANALPTFPLHTRPIFLASFISPQFLLPRIYLHCYRPFFFRLTFCLAPVSFAAFLSLTVSSHSFDFIFISSQFFPLFSLLQSCPILLA